MNISSLTTAEMLKVIQLGGVFNYGHLTISSTSNFLF